MTGKEGRKGRSDVKEKNKPLNRRGMEKDKERKGTKYGQRLGQGENKDRERTRTGT